MSNGKIELSYKVVGGKLKTIELNRGATVADLVKEAVLSGNYSATIGSNPAELTDTVEEGMTVFLAPQVKGAVEMCNQMRLYKRFLRLARLN